VLLLALLSGCGTCDARNSSPGNPIQDAIDAAEPGDEVVVCGGTYKGTLSIDKELTLTAESEDARVFVDGELSGPILTITDAAVTVQDIGFQHAGTDADGRGGAIWIEQDNSLSLPYVVLENVLIEDGRDSGVVLTGGTLIGRHLTVQDSRAEVGAALRVLAGEVSLDEPTFEGNDADLGGALYVDDGGEVTMTSGRICENRATNGGGAWLVAASTEEPPGTLTAISSDWCEGDEDNFPDDVATTDNSYLFGDNVDFTLSGPS